MEKINRTIRFIIVIVLLSPMLYSSCYRNEQVLPKKILTKEDTINIVKNFVNDITRSLYLWEKFIPGDVDINSYDDPKKLFEAMYYPKLDHWSFVTEDYLALQNDLDGVRKASGFKFRPFLYEEGKPKVFMFVEYIYAEGNAFKSGLKRGNIITKINGTKLNKDNLYKLMANDELTLSLAEMQGKEIVELNKTVKVTKKEQSFNPILQHKVITKNNKKIAYFLFDQFISDYDEDMVNVMNSFKNEGIDDLVLDLRFNSGGYVSTCSKLGSMITSKENIGKLFLTFQWNDIVTKEFESNPKYEQNLKLKFPETNVNLGLKNLYVLCSDRTASASEAIVNCLRPYMNVVLIGTKTVGKYTAVNVFSDKHVPSWHNWAIFLVTSKIANANGVTDYIDGFTPDVIVKDNYTTPLGDENEPLFAKALELITGATAKKAIYELPDNIKIMEPVYSSDFEKQSLFINDTDVNVLLK